MPEMRGSVKKWLLSALSYPEGKKMRTRKAIEQDGSRSDLLSLEVLLDIRELLIKVLKKKKKIGGKNAN